MKSIPLQHFEGVVGGKPSVAGETKRRHEHVGDGADRLAQGAHPKLAAFPLEHVPPVHALPIE
jgi:hypothetical protein